MYAMGRILLDNIWNIMVIYLNKFNGNTTINNNSTVIHTGKSKGIQETLSVNKKFWGLQVKANDGAIL